MLKEDKPENNQKFTVKILGDEFTVTGEISDQHVQKLQELINSIGREINVAYPHLPRRRLWGLTAINMAHKYFKLLKKKQKLTQENRQLTRENEQLQKTLESLKKDYQELSLLLEEVDD